MSSYNINWSSWSYSLYAHYSFVSLLLSLKIISVEKALGVGVSEHKQGFFLIFHNGVLWDLFLIWLIILFDALHEMSLTTGLKGGFSFFCAILSHSTSASHGCYMISSMPLAPSLACGFLRSSCMWLVIPDWRSRARWATIWMVAHRCGFAPAWIACAPWSPFYHAPHRAVFQAWTRSQWPRLRSSRQ